MQMPEIKNVAAEAYSGNEVLTANIAPTINGEMIPALFFVMWNVESVSQSTSHPNDTLKLPYTAFLKKKLENLQTRHGRRDATSGAPDLGREYLGRIGVEDGVIQCRQQTENR